MMKYEKMVLLLAALCAACSGSGEEHPTAGRSVAAPSEIAVERLGNTTVRLTWQDNSDNETGFSVWVRDADDIDRTSEVGRVGADVTEFTIASGLQEGRYYYLGVKAEGAADELSSRVVYTLYNLVALADAPLAELAGSAVSTESCIAVRYRVLNAPAQSGVRYGLCWSCEHTPTVADLLQYGPALPEGGGAMLQVIPNTLLEYGREYRIRAFAVSPLGTFYSAETRASLAAEPEAIRLNWTKLQKSALPAGVELYETQDKLNGRNFHAWYAVADPAQGVELRVMVPSGAQTIDQQAAAAGDCLVLVNGGYFYNGSHTGLAVLNGSATGTIPAVRGSLRTGEAEYGVMYNVTRGLFGVDAAGKPAVYWAGTDASGSARYFDRPLPSVKGEAKYDAVSAANPTDAVSWSPKYALSAGPVLLKEGKCPFDFTETEKGTEFFLNNYEIMPYDIFGASVICDRTAAGYLADGRIVLFICDGRIAESPGANLTELARILRGIGCVEAVNFDGGGSTGMMVGSEHLNDQTPNNRPVVSTIGFFKTK